MTTFGPTHASQGRTICQWFSTISAEPYFCLLWDLLADYGKQRCGDQPGCLPVSSSSARPNLGEVSAEVQFEVARNAVTDMCGSWHGALAHRAEAEKWEDTSRRSTEARRRLASRTRLIWAFAAASVFHGRTRPDAGQEHRQQESSLVIIQRAVHPAIALVDISVEIVAS